MPIFGQLCRIFGRKLFYIVGFVVFTAASALCGFAPDLLTLIGLRFLQGVGGAMIGANSMALVVEATDKSRRGARAWPLCRRPSGRDQCRPCRRRAFDRDFGWPWVFWVNVPLGLVSIVAGWLVLPITPRQNSRPTFDWRGALLLAPALTFAVLALNQISAWGPTSPALLGLGRRRDRADLSVPEAGTRVAFAADRSCAASASRRFSPARWPARSRTPCFTACSSSLHSRS